MIHFLCSETVTCGSSHNSQNCVCQEHWYAQLCTLTVGNCQAIMDGQCLAEPCNGFQERCSGLNRCVEFTLTSMSLRTTTFHSMLCVRLSSLDSLSLATSVHVAWEWLQHHQHLFDPCLTTCQEQVSSVVTAGHCRRLTTLSRSHDHAD